MDALRRMVAALRAHDSMGLILDIVPNHMGVGGDRQRLVARRAGMGPRQPVSPSSSTSTGIRLTPRCAAACSHPFLGDAYGAVLAAATS